LGPMARRLRVRSDWLRAEAEAGRLPAVKAGDTWLFDSNLIERLLLERARGGAAGDTTDGATGEGVADER